MMIIEMSRKKNIFKQFKLLRFIGIILSYFGLYLKLKWSNNSFLFSAAQLGLSPTNKYKDYTYKVIVVYLVKKERDKLKSNKSLSFYSNYLTFILT